MKVDAGPFHQKKALRKDLDLLCSFWSRSHRDSFTILSFCLEDGEFYMIPEDSEFVTQMAGMFNSTLENVCADMGWETRMSKYCNLRNSPFFTQISWLLIN